MYALYSSSGTILRPGRLQYKALQARLYSKPHNLTDPLKQLLHTTTADSHGQEVAAAGPMARDLPHPPALRRGGAAQVRGLRTAVVAEHDERADLAIEAQGAKRLNQTDAKTYLHLTRHCCPGTF